MIKRETYMNRIRPFIGNELIKVLTGIRRSGKSVMLDLSLIHISTDEKKLLQTKHRLEEAEMRDRQKAVSYTHLITC